MAHLSESELSQVNDKTKEQVEVGSQYSHYKNPDHTYKVLAVGFIEDTEEPCVVYQAEYGEKLVWVRTLEQWSAVVDNNGQPTPRFTKVS